MVLRSSSDLMENEKLSAAVLMLFLIYHGIEGVINAIKEVKKYQLKLLVVMLLLQKLAGDA